MDKPILKARYQECNDESEENWQNVHYEVGEELELKHDFVSLIELEQERFLEYFETSQDFRTTVEILIDRECEFMRKIERIVGDSLKRKRQDLEPAPTLSPFLKSSYSPTIVSNATSLCYSSNNSSCSSLDQFMSIL